MRFNVACYSQLNANQLEWVKPSYFQDDDYKIIELKNQEGLVTKYQFGEGYLFSAGNTNDAFPKWIDILKLYVGKSDAFRELIDLSFDNQSIGSPIFTKLYEDFEEHHEKVKEFAFSGKPDEYSYYHRLWYSKFVNWHAAFRIASQNGVILTDLFKYKPNEKQDLTFDESIFSFH